MGFWKGFLGVAVPGSVAAALLINSPKTDSTENTEDTLYKKPVAVQRAQPEEYKVSRADIGLVGEPFPYAVPLITENNYSPPDSLETAETELYKFNIRDNFSPNYTKGRKAPISGIALHTTEGSGDGAEAWLTNPKSKVSAHYLIKEDGGIVRLVRDEDTAWHVRGHNQYTIGIEFAGTYTEPITQSQLDAGTELIRDLQRKYGIARDRIRAHSELDPARRKDPGKINMSLLMNALFED